MSIEETASELNKAGSVSKAGSALVNVIQGSARSSNGNGDRDPS